MSVEKVRKMTNGYKTTREGGVGYEPTLREKLAEFFSLGLLNGNFYQTEEEVLKNAKALFEEALAKEPYFATQCAVYGNNVNSLKLVPTIWLVYLSTMEDKTLFKSAFPRIIRNPKMLHDFMELARKAGIRQGIGRSVKKVINEWLISHLNEYQVSRNKNKLAEIIKVTRPVHSAEEFQNFMKYLAKDEITFPRAKALKDVIAFMEEGQLNDTVLTLIEVNRLQLEELKHATKKLAEEDKQKLYEVMYKGLNFTALILNLVALERVFATQTRSRTGYRMQNGRYQSFKQVEVIETDIPTRLVDLLASRLADVEAYRRSNMLPFALINAERMVKTPEFKQAIGKLLQNVAEETFDINKEKSVFVGVDTSGSMQTPVNDSGTLSAVDVASLFGAMVKKSHTNTQLYAVASYIKEVNAPKQLGVFEMAERIQRTDVGYGTYFEQVMKRYDNEDYLILITDSEQADNLERQFLKKRKPGAKLIVWQLVPYNTRISKHHDVVYVCGYSDRLLSLVKNIIEGKLGQIEEIEKIKL